MSDLPNAGLLSMLDEDMRVQLAPYGSIVNTMAEQRVINQGLTNKYFYIVVEGIFKVTSEGPIADVELEEVGRGDCFGEVALFDPGIATATVISVGAGRIWLTDLVMFQHFLFECDVAGCALLVGINTLLSRRLKRSNQIIKNNQIMPSFLSVRNRRRITESGSMPKVEADAK